MDGDHLPANPCWYPGDYRGEVAAIPAGSGFGGRNSTDDLFELVWGEGGGGATGRPLISRLRSSRSPARPAPPLPSEGMPLDTPPSEDVMAAWLYPIVSGQDHDGDALKTPMIKEASEAIGSSKTLMTERKEKLLSSEGMSGTKGANTRSDSGEMKVSGGPSSRRGSSQNCGTHNITEKRRRCKITQRLRTLQQLVPGCDKLNQASTLDQTIQYMKSLQNHVQAMRMRPASPPSVAAAGYPIFNTPAASVAMPMPMPSAAVDPRMVPMVPFGAMLPYPHYHTMTMPATGAAVMDSPLYRPAPAAPSDATAAGLDLRQCSVSMEQQQQKKERGRKRS